MTTTPLRTPAALAIVAVVVAAVVAVGLGVSLLGSEQGLVLRIVLWSLAGVALLARAPARPEPTWAIRLLGAATLVIALGWTVVAVGADPSTVVTADLSVLTAGMAGIGIAILVATPTWRHRAELLDGVVVVLGCTAFLVAVVIHALATTPPGEVVAAVFAATFAAMLGTGVMVATLLTRTLRPGPGSLAPAIGLVTLFYAGATTATTVLVGAPVGTTAALAWALAPLAGLAMAVWPAPPYWEPRDAPAETRSSPVRLLVLGATALAPGVGGLAAEPELVVGGLLVSVIASLLLAARLALSAQFQLEDVRAAASVRFDALVDHAVEVLALLDEQGRLFYVSRAVEGTFGVAPSDVLGRTPADLVHPDDVETVLDLLGRVDELGEPVNARIRLVDGRRRTRHADVTIADLRDVRGVKAISLTVRDVTERVALEAELVRQARTDGLTGLVNRSVLIERVEHILTARRARAALLFIDLDDFKLINDGFGHASGDEVLAVLAGRLQRALREHDTAGRMGGDEFAILLEELTDEPINDALHIAERIVASCREPINVDGETVEVQLSIGVALPEGSMTAAELFACADAAMYEAKRDKRGVVLFEPGMRASSRSRLRLMRDVRVAIEEGTLEVSYQPIVRTSTHELQGVEALLRWVHPTLGPIAPDAILDHAEAAGATADLTHAIIDEISADMRRWRDRVGTPLEVAINLSAQQLVHVDPQEVLLRLVGSGQAAGLVTIEVTETSMLGDITAAARVLDAFREAGCHVAIDDFGTGYASIGYLRQLPLDKLKIDREFVTGLTPATAHGSFASVIQGLASALALTTVAEGVETEAQLAAVELLGCDLVQGFLFSRGLPMDALIAWCAAEGHGELTGPQTVALERA